MVSAVTYVLEFWTVSKSTESMGSEQYGKGKY